MIAEIIDWLVESVIRGTGFFMIMVGAIGGVFLCIIPFAAEWSIALCILFPYAGIVGGLMLSRIGLNLIDYIS